jgi:hypothetical protein
MECLNESVGRTGDGARERGVDCVDGRDVVHNGFDADTSKAAHKIKLSPIQAQRADLGTHGRLRCLPGCWLADVYLIRGRLVRQCFYKEMREYRLPCILTTCL